MAVAVGAEEGDPDAETVVREDHPLQLVMHPDAHVQLGPRSIHWISIFIGYPFQGEQDFLRSLERNIQSSGYVMYILQSMSYDDESWLGYVQGDSGGRVPELG